MSIEKDIDGIKEAIKYLARGIDEIIKTTDRVNNVDTYNKSIYETEKKVDELLSNEIEEEEKEV